MNTNTNTIIKNQAFVEFDKVYNKVVNFIFMNTIEAEFRYIRFEVNDDLAPETVQVFLSSKFTDDDDLIKVVGDVTLELLCNHDFTDALEKAFVNVKKTKLILDKENKCIFMTYIIPVEDNICK